MFILEVALDFDSKILSFKITKSQGLPLSWKSGQLSTWAHKCQGYYGMTSAMVGKICPPGWNSSAKVKFIYSEKATKFCEIPTLNLTAVHTVKSKVEISQNFVVFSEYMNFIHKCNRNVPEIITKKILMLLCPLTFSFLYIYFYMSVLIISISLWN